MRAYFDRNIFGDIKRLKDSPESTEDITKLQQAVDNGKITVALSTTVLEETLPSLKHSADTLKKEMNVILGLVDKRRMIKLPPDLLREAIQSYAFARRLPDMYTKPPRFLSDFFNKRKITCELRQFIDEIASQKERFVSNFTEAFTKAKQAGEEREIGRPDNFEEFWNGMALSIAEGLAVDYALHKQCSVRGLEGMLENKTIKLYTIYYAAWVFFKWFGEQGKPGKVKASESGDFFHAVQASAADILVTNDSKFSRWLKQAPIDDFQIITFTELIEQL